MLTYSLKVENITRETDDAITVSFKQPALKKVKYLAGQYLTLIFKINGRRYIRPYSFSSAPGVDSTLDITIKRVAGGIVSNHIFDKVKIGDIVEVYKPLGDFVIDKVPGELQNKRIVLWGSGSGITPLMSLSKYVLNTGCCKHVTLVYGNRSFETTIFSEKLLEMQKQYHDSFSVWHFHTKGIVLDSSPYVVQGRIDPEIVWDVISHESDINDTVHFICGAVGLKESVKKTLLKFGIKNEVVFSEDFEVMRNPADFKDIITQNVNLTVNNQTTLLEVIKGKSILEAGLDAGMDLAYSCQTGNCKLCKATIKSGDIKVIGVDVRQEELAENECLLCCSFPLNGEVSLAVEI